MRSVRASGSKGYAKRAEALVLQYESLPVSAVHGWMIRLCPPIPGRVLDNRLGTGARRGPSAAMGRGVAAVELRARAATLHPSPRIERVDDGLPDPPRLAGRAEGCGVVVLTAVWMHLDDGQRRRALPDAARRLVRSGGVAALTPRHGPVPPGRHLFDVHAEETVRLAEAEGPRTALWPEDQTPASRRAEVHWTLLAFAGADRRA